MTDWYATIATIAAIIIGPLAAVLITERNALRQRQHQARVQILRMLLNTRGLPADPNWFIAINSIPIEFHGDAKIVAACRSFLEAVRFKPAAVNAEASRTNVAAKQTALIFAIAQKLHYDITENDIQNEAYYSDGFIIRDNLMLDSWHALARIADCQEALQRRIEAQAPAQLSE